MQGGAGRGGGDVRPWPFLVVQKERTRKPVQEGVQRGTDVHCWFTRTADLV